MEQGDEKTEREDSELCRPIGLIEYRQIVKSVLHDLAIGNAEIYLKRKGKI